MDPKAQAPTLNVGVIAVLRLYIQQRRLSLLSLARPQCYGSTRAAG